jgi:DNA-binding LytR/AlgR family response regulator
MSLEPAPPITVLIADDEEAPREQLRAALAQVWPEAQVVAAAVNGADAWDAFLEHEPDLCFLDIRMPGLTGLEVAQRINGESPVVFVTAHGDHALAAFDAGAVDYVLKPVDVPRLAQAVQRARQRLAAAAPSPAGPAAPGDLQALLQQLVAQARPRPTVEVIQATVGREVRLIPVAEVIYFESDARYTRVVHEGGDALIRTPLKELLTQLDGQQFWQVHRSVIVQQRHVQAAVRSDDGNMHLTLRGRPEKLAVSRHFQGLFKGQ